VEIVPYEEKYEQAFIDLNTAWVEKYFVMEQEDRDILYHVTDFLKSGAMIFFAVEDDEVLATCMTVHFGNNVWELCKMAAREDRQGSGAGSAVFQACMEYAICHGAEKITLISNHILKPALHIYDKFGFQQVPLCRVGEYQRADVQYEYIVPPSRSPSVPGSRRIIFSPQIFQNRA